MKPTLRDVSTDPVLSNVAIAYENEGYIAELILKPYISTKQSGKYYKFDKAKFRNEYDKRAPGAKSKEATPWNVSTGTFFCEDHALKDIVPKEIEDQADAPIDAQKDTVEALTEVLKVNKEKAAADYLTSSTNITQYTALSGTSQWSDFENSDPIKDIKTGKSTVHASIFKDPNVLVLGKPVFDKLVDHPDIVERIKYSGPGVVAEDVLARVFQVEKVLVAGAGYNSVKEGQTDSMSYIWGKNALLCYVNNGSNLKSITLGWTVKYQNFTVKKWYDEDAEGTYIRVNEYYDQVYACPTAAYLIQTAVA